eukprot:SAG31_NODE_3281_length_4468_cov_56.874571_3_plen_49_part_00
MRSSAAHEQVAAARAGGGRPRRVRAVRTYGTVTSQIASTLGTYLDVGT